MKKRVTASKVAQERAETLGDQLQNAGLSGRWRNYGDVNYLEHGGVQLRVGEDGDMVDYVELYPADELDDMVYGIAQGTYWISDLIENVEYLEQTYGSAQEWPMSEVVLTPLANKVVKYVGMDATHIDIISIMLGVPSYGGVERNITNVTIQEDDQSPLLDALPPGLDI